MEIVKYVAELIQFHREVGIDGFGTIYKKKSPGRYDSVSRSFLPPGSTIAFKQELSDNNLLNNELAAKENLSPEAAAEATSVFVIRLNQQLADKGYADFSPIGVLRKIDGNVVLENDTNFKSGADFFGLPAVPEPVRETPAVEETPAAEEPVAIIPATPVIPVTLPVPTTVEAEPEAPEVPAPPVPESKQEAIISENLMEEENPGKETNEQMLNEIRRPIIENKINYTIREESAPEGGSLLTKVAVILLGILLLSIAAYYLYPRISSSFTPEPTVPTETEKIDTDSLARATREQEILDSASQADSLAEASLKMEKRPSVDSVKKVVPTAKAAQDTVITYEVIGASVLNEKEASWFIETMKKSGIKAKVVENAPGKRLKMSIATLKDEASAKAERDRLGEKLKIKGLYIYKNKSK